MYIINTLIQTFIFVQIFNFRKNLHCSYCCEYFAEWLHSAKIFEKTRIWTLFQSQSEIMKRVI